MFRTRALVCAATIGLVSIAFAGALSAQTKQTKQQPAQAKQPPMDRGVETHVRDMLAQGRQIFRFDTFGSEDFWGGKLKLHQAIQGEKLGGVGPGVSPKTALELGLKVDMEAVPRNVAVAIKAGRVDLNDPANTLLLLKANAVVGVTGFFDRGGQLQSMGIQCALCHSTVD